MITIDAGCGNRKKGDIGLDIVKTNAVDVLCSLNNIPLKNNSVDRIISDHVIEHIESPINVLREFHRILRIGGELIISAPHAFTLGAYSIDHKNYYVLRSFDYICNPELVKYWCSINIG